MTVAAVKLWNKQIGAVAWDESRRCGNFEYEEDFVRSRIELSPLVMPLERGRIYSFPALAWETFHGLPGMLADSLPDKFGTALINAWLASQGRTPGSMNPVERLCYIGTRGMGGLEFSPDTGPKKSKSNVVYVDKLVELAGEILTRREEFSVSIEDKEKTEALRDILRVGTSAGGARAKAVIAWNPDTDEVRSGQIETEKGFSYWILKFDGVSGNKDKELEDPRGYGLIEFAYSKMASKAGIKMSECRILEEEGRKHFMTKRFDRTEGGEKIHMQSLCAMAHYDFNLARAYSYEQALGAMQKLDLTMDEKEEQFRRMVFNVVCRNQDDHVKNIAFLMNKAGEWRLSPAFDVTYSYNPSGKWTGQHQMSINGKTDDFELEDFEACANTASLKRGRYKEILDQVQTAAQDWPGMAKEVGIPDDTIRRIKNAHRFFTIKTS